MKRLSSNYTAEFDNITEAEWSDALRLFDDACLFQTWQYGTTFWSRKNLTHAVLKKNGKIISLAQGRIVKIPGLPLGIANFLHAPLWQLKNEQNNPEILRIMLKILKDEYVIRRGCLLRIRSYEQNIYSKNSSVHSMFQKEGFHIQEKPFYRTIRLDLKPSIEKLRKKLKPKWRRNLSRAERNNLTVRSGSGKELFDTFISLHSEMFSRKQLGSGFNPDLEKYYKMQQEMSGEFKLIIFLCELDGKPLAAHLLSAIGDTGNDMYGATSNNAIRKNLNASYLLKWETIKWLKDHGYTFYDLRGYNPTGYPGVSYFKEGFSGKDVSYAEFHAYQSKVGYMLLTRIEELTYRFKILRSGAY